MIEELIIADPETNSYRIVRMVQEGELFSIYTGRAGFDLAKVQSKPMRYWESFRQRKLDEGFTPRTNLVRTVTKGGYKPIEDPVVRDIIGYLLSASRKYSEKTHVFTEISEITPEMVAKAQALIDEIAAGADTHDLSWINQRVVWLLSTTPRRCEDVSALLAGPDAPVSDVLSREQAALDILSSQVTVAASETPDKTVLETHGIKARPVRDSEERSILRHMDRETASRYVRALRINNEERDNIFATHMADNGMDEGDIHYLYHGSKNENWIGLIVEGPKLHPDAAVTGKALGNGIYFANRAQKSAGYTDGGKWNSRHASRCYMAVYKVAYINPLITSSVRSYSARSIAPHDIVYFKGGGAFVWDEYCVFDPKMITLQYLIELKPM